VPTDDPNADVRMKHQLPPRSMLLTCAERLKVSVHKRGNADPEQTMTGQGELVHPVRRVRGVGAR